jgi:membrane carboxypeptidase/penicillin-binding protein PbpC
VNDVSGASAVSQHAFAASLSVVSHSPVPILHAPTMPRGANKNKVAAAAAAAIKDQKDNIEAEEGEHSESEVEAGEEDDAPTAAVVPDQMAAIAAMFSNMMVQQQQATAAMMQQMQQQMQLKIDTVAAQAVRQFTSHARIALALRKLCADYVQPLCNSCVNNAHYLFFVCALDGQRLWRIRWKER